VKSVSILCGHGIGDAILGLQCASHTRVLYTNVIACCRDEVFAPLKEAFGSMFAFSQHSSKQKWGEDNWILSNLDKIKEDYGLSDETYYVIPDLLYRNPLAFDWRKYRVSPQTIKATRLLTHKWEPQKRIYVGLSSSHPDYQFKSIDVLLRALAVNFPDYEIFFPNLPSWNGKQLDDHLGNTDYPSNVICDGNCIASETVEKLRTSAYSIFVDNGFSHLAYQFGVPRLVLDHHYGNPAFEARWRENNEDYIPYTEKLEEILSIIFNNIHHPETLLLNKNWLKDANVDWSKALLFKY
jgi:hypothetical protein